MKSADTIVLALFLICGFGIGSTYVGAARQERVLPQEPGFNQRIFGAALMSVCGRGLVTPDVPMTAAAGTPASRLPLIEFLAQRRETIGCGEIPADVPAGGLDGMQQASRYLLMLVTTTWSMTGPAWAGIDRLLGLMFGLSVAMVYLLGRLAMGRLISAGIATLMMLSPLQLLNLPDLRDYSKAPFFTASLLIVGFLVMRERRGVVIVGLSGVAGALLGFGFGVRTDIIVYLVLVLAAIAGSLPERAPGAWAYAWKVRLIALAVCLACFAAVASPILGSRESGSNVWHWALLGYAHEWDRALDVAPAPYEPGYFYNDSYVGTVVDAYWGRTTQATQQVSVGVSQYAAASRDYYSKIVTTFPADTLLRGWAAVIQVLDLPYSGVHSIPRGLLPDWLTRLFALIGRGRVLLAGAGLLLFGIVTLALSIWSVRLAALMFGIVAFLGAYPAIQFQQRHIFHLELLSLWLLGLAVSFASSVLVRRFRRLPVLSTPDAHSTSLIVRPLAFTGSIALLIFVPLTSLRAFQERSATALLSAYEAAEVQPLTFTTERLPSGLVRAAIAPGVLVHDTRSMNSDMLIAEVSSSGCSVDRVGLEFRYSPRDPAMDFSRMLDIEVPPGGQSAKVFFPVYETGATNPDPELLVFSGLELAEAELPCLKRVGRFSMPDRYPLLLTTVLSPDWRKMPLHQSLHATPKGSQTIPYWAPLALRERRGALFAQLPSTRPGVNAAVDYAARIATLDGSGSIAVNGVADGPDSYLVAWKDMPLAESAVVVAEGRLERGGLSVGLADATGWVARVEIETPGGFRALVQVPRPGQYQLVVANHLSNTTLRNRFTISRITMMDGAHE